MRTATGLFAKKIMWFGIMIFFAMLAFMVAPISLTTAIGLVLCTGQNV